MNRRTVSARGLLLASACLFFAAAAPRKATGQEWPAAQNSDPLAVTVRKLDDYGKIGHCDETARLDNFAITLQNEPNSKGYLMVYVGKDDLPAWWDAILERAANYLVTSRGLDRERLRVVNGGFREERTTELWVVPEGATPPEPTNTVEVKLDRTKADKWNEKSFEVTFTPDPLEEESEAEESEEEETAVGEAVAGDGPAEAAAGEAEPGAEDDGPPEPGSKAEAAWRKQVEKYEISVVSRGVFEDEPQPVGEAVEEDSGAAGAGAAEGDAAEVKVGEAEAPQAAQVEEPPAVGEIEVSIWWDVERLADELKAASPAARVYLVYYWGVKSANRETVLKLVEGALAKTQAQLGIGRERIVAVDGGQSSDPGVEVWVVPPGAEAPKPRPGQKRDFGFYTMPGDE